MVPKLLNKRKMLKKYWLILLISSPLTACASVKSMTCQNNWQLTGYFVPIEKDYSSHSPRKITMMDGKIISFDNTFLAAVKLEGWGKTTDGWYLGFYSNQWHKSQHPLNAKGKPLTLSSIAADITQLPFGRMIYIPTLNSTIKQPFKVNDVGQAIKGKRIDIFTGEGKKAQLLTYQITNKHKICWQN
jgi:3D (Asp-Asp-Asp) domain-containing protein